jgi:hypothetical protein
LRFGHLDVCYWQPAIRATDAHQEPQVLESLKMTNDK